MSADAPALGPGRIDGLDGWRAGLMVAGILLHASSWLPTRPLFEAIALLSHTFRMGAFFAISGFVGARALAGRPARLWLARRLIQIGFPTLFGLAVLCPLVTALVAAMPGGHPRLVLNWYHLWFLVALLLYAPLAVAAEEADRRWGIWAWLGRRYGGARCLKPLLGAVGLLCFLLLLVSSLAIGGIGTAATMPFLDGWRSIAGYWPDYLLGFAVARSPELRATLLRDWRSPAVLLAALISAYAAWFLLIGPWSGPALRLWGDGLLPLVGEAIAPPATFALILQSSVRVGGLGRSARQLADASFTIYIAHVPVIAALTVLFAHAPLSVGVKYVLIATTTLGLTLFFHHGCVRRSTWLSLVFCGKALTPTTARVGRATLAVAAALRRI